MVIPLSVRSHRVQSIPPLLFKVGIQMVCGYILGSWSVAHMYHVKVTVALTSDLSFVIIVSGAYFLYYLACGYIFGSL